MAFTIEEIEKAIATTTRIQQILGNEEMRNHPNYSVIIDYLTGKSNSLNGLQSAYNIIQLVRIVDLLGNIDELSPKDKLVFDIIFHPLVYPYMRESLNNWIIKSIKEKETQEVLNAALLLYKSLGLNEDEIFIQLVFGFHFKNSNESLNNPITEGLINHYLLNYIKLANKLILPSNYIWSAFYFKLIELAKPEFLLHYIQEGICKDYNFPLLLFKVYQDGKYLNPILEILTNQQNPNIATLIMKFRLAISLYDTENGFFSDLVSQISKQYLDFYRIHTPKETWENVYYKQPKSLIPIGNLKMSAYSFFFLLTYKKEQAILTLSEWMDENVFMNTDILTIIPSFLKGEDLLPYFAYAIKTTAPVGGARYYQSVIELMKKSFTPKEYLPIIWSLINHKSKPLRELVAKVIAENDEESENKAIKLLESKHSDIRQIAAIILSFSDSTKATEAIMNVLNKEVNDNARDILLQSVRDALPKEANSDFLTAMIEAAKKRSKLEKPIEPWLEESLLPAIYFQDGSLLNHETIRFLFYRATRAKGINSDIEAKFILNKIDKEKATPFALFLLKIFREKDTKPEHKYLMALATQLGGNEIVDKIRTTTNSWIEYNRHKMAEYGVEALALNGSDKALRWVEWYSRKYRNKKANVGAAALKALITAAEELGITTHELGDKIVPDFGFDGLFKSFEVDGEEFRAFIDSKFKIAFFDEDNKQLKSIPAKASTSLKDEFKTISKEIREIVKSQSPRLEYYLIIQRKWSFSQWQQFFLNNPVMFIYATKLVWGIYNSKEELQGTFICNDDTAFLNEDGEEIEVNQESNIVIVHPTQLSAESLKNWQKFLYKQSIEQVFPQLNRKVPDLSDIDSSKCIIHKYSDKQMAVGSITTTLLKYGWQHGPAGDAGMIDSFSLFHLEKNIEGILEVEGVGAGYGWGNDEKLGRLYFIDKNKMSKKSMGYIKDDTDTRLVRIVDLPSIFFSEAIVAIETIKPFVNK